ncbi:MAG: hypothetical protein AVDCRST_MAG73-3021, partial [uncultured Thermomicrobiales bacterium]
CPDAMRSAAPRPILTTRNGRRRRRSSRPGPRRSRTTSSRPGRGGSPSRGPTTRGRGTGCRRTRRKTWPRRGSPARPSRRGA